MALMWNRTVDWDSGDWRRVAACRHTEPDLFFPVGTTGPAIDQIETAKRVCRTCEAQEPCLDFALATNQESGVWGGTSEEERRKLRKAWLAARRSNRAAPERTRPNSPAGLTNRFPCGADQPCSAPRPTGGHPDKDTGPAPVVWLDAFHGDRSV